jgi:copper homeostasis protein CutC
VGGNYDSAMIRKLGVAGVGYGQMGDHSTVDLRAVNSGLSTVEELGLTDEE